jgi:Zn-dependent protease with chaperone function
VLVGIGALLVFSMTPVFGHHLASGANALLAGRDHFLHVCLIALHLLLEPVHLAFHVLLAAGVLYAIVDRTRAMLAVRGIVGLVEWTAPRPHDAIWEAARAAGIPADRVRVGVGLPNPAFTVGWFAPCVYIASELADSLSGPQLTAVLAHEGAHVSRRDPLRLSALRFLACTLFYLPAMRRLADDVADEAEVAADDLALEGCDASGAAILASAIVDIAVRWDLSSRKGQWVDAAMVGFQRADLLERRVRRLLGQEAVVGTHVTRRSIAGAAFALAVVWMSGLVMAHPLPAVIEGRARWFGTGGDHMASVHSAGHGVHCDHRGALALTHLFCLGWHAHETGSPCPHMTVAGRSTATPG